MKSLKIKQIPKKDQLFFGIVILFSVVLFWLPTGYENSTLTSDTLYEKAVVVSTDNSKIETFGIVSTGTQYLKLKIISGKFKGDSVSAENSILGQKKLDKIFKVGDKALTIVQLTPDHSQIKAARAYDYYRQGYEIWLFVLFALFLILFAKFTGFKALLSFVFTALAFWKLLIPAFLNGYNPILISLGIVSLTSSVIILLVGGLSKKGIVALLGTFAGVIATAILSLSFGYFFKIPGAVQDYAEALLYTGFSSLDLSGIFLSVIFVSSAGAVMDVSMDISAALCEIYTRMPELTAKELMKSGFRIAAPVLGSMTTTLLFAYSGSFMFAFMAFMAKGTPFTYIVNTGYIAAEILHTLIGSFGLALVAPLTAIIGGFIYASKSNAKIAKS